MIRFIFILLILCNSSYSGDPLLERYGDMGIQLPEGLKEKLTELAEKSAEEKKSGSSSSSSSDFDTSFLIASLIWGSIGGGYFMYGKKSQKPLALIGGLVLMVSSYMLSPLLMSLVGIGVMVGVYKTH